MEYPSALKTNEQKKKKKKGYLTICDNWLNLEDITLCEISQS